MPKDRRLPPDAPAEPLLVGEPNESPVEAGTLADAEGLDGLEYVTGTPPYESLDEMLMDSEREPHSEDARDWEAPEEVLASPVAGDERDDVNTSDDVDRQGRRGQEERDWYGDAFADSGRHRPSDGGRPRRRTGGSEE